MPDLMCLYQGAARQDRTLRAATTNLATAWDGLADRNGLYADLAEVFLGGASQGAETTLRRHADDLAWLVEPAGQSLARRFFARASRDLGATFGRIRRVESKAGHNLSHLDLLANVEFGVRSALYGSVRSRYNEARFAGRFDAFRSADLLFLRELAFGAMFRFNAKDEFNVPYGGISYNRQSLGPKVTLLFGEAMLERLSNTTFACQDFETFLTTTALVPNDFLFVDPPYDSDFSAYDNMPFGPADHVRLRNALEAAPCRVMVVINDTPRVRSLYGSGRWHVKESRKTYAWTIKSRNDRQATHLTISNY